MPVYRHTIRNFPDPEKKFLFIHIPRTAGRFFTENIKLNALVGKEFFVGNIKLKAHDLCRPCKYLQDRLKQKNFVKEFLYKGGLCCEILTTGKIYVGDIIK